MLFQRSEQASCYSCTFLHQYGALLGTKMKINARICTYKCGSARYRLWFPRFLRLPVCCCSRGIVHYIRAEGISNRFPINILMHLQHDEVCFKGQDGSGSVCASFAGCSYSAWGGVYPVDPLETYKDVCQPVFGM